MSLTSLIARLPLLLTLCVAVFWASGSRGEIASADFISMPVANDQQLAKHLSKAALEGTLAMIEERRCPWDGIMVHNPRPDGKMLIVTVACYPSLELDQTSDRYYAYFEYPLTIVVKGDIVTEINLSEYGFMYQSGRIEFIADSDRNDMPEFGLSGNVCECDGEPGIYGPEGCNCDGETVVEFRNGSLHLWEPKK